MCDNRFTCEEVGSLDFSGEGTTTCAVFLGNMEEDSRRLSLNPSTYRSQTPYA